MAHCTASSDGVVGQADRLIRLHVASLTSLTRQFLHNIRLMSNGLAGAIRPKPTLSERSCWGWRCSVCV